MIALRQPTASSPVNVDQVVLVNDQDEEIGVASKLEAHEQNLLHRAFSLLLFNDNNELLIQQRAFHKYHSAGLWSNTCCSHQRPGESTPEAIERRLKEELNMYCTDIEPKFNMLYQIPFENGLFEHELDHVYLGHTRCKPCLNLDEIVAWKWVSLEELTTDLAQNPHNYTYWFHLIMDRLHHQLPLSLRSV